MTTVAHRLSADPTAQYGDVSMPNHRPYSSRRLTLSDMERNDNRYPSNPYSSPPPRNAPPRFEAAREAGMTSAMRASIVHSPDLKSPGPSWLGENIVEEVDDWDTQQRGMMTQMQQQYEDAQSPRVQDNTSYGRGSPGGRSLPPPTPYNMDDSMAGRPSDDGGKYAADPNFRYSDMARQQSSPSPTPQYMQSSPRFANLALNGASASPRHPSLPGAGIGAPSSSQSPSAPIIPLSAGPTYNPASMQIPVSQKPRAYAQHPTYITPTTSPNAMQPTFSPPQPKEEICVECAMRDADMADVDVTGPGVWDRESDVQYEELCRREAEETASGRTSSDSHSRPRATGGKLSEENLRFWTSINPREPSSRQQTLDQYVKSQRMLLEAEALARARALRESRMLDEKMRDTYSQLRRSAYELSASPSPVEDANAGLRLKARVASVPSTSNNAQHSKEVTLLENGLIVEHVDVRKEEKEERDRKRKEVKRERSRARKSSRSSRSGIDVSSVYSLPTPSPIPQADSGFFSAGVSRNSQNFSPRPSSVMSPGDNRQSLLRAQSQASFSDMQSMMSASSPRRSRFFGFKNLSGAWQSRDSVAQSGSMMDMHVALQREQQYFDAHPSQLDLSNSNAPTLRVSQSWPRGATSPDPALSTAPVSKKKNGLKKIWKLVTGSKGASKGVSQSRSVDRHEDDAPLAPPPPLSYLVDREGGARRHVSTPSLLSSVSPNAFSALAPSPPTAPSSVIPSPTSSRHPVPDNGLDTQKEEIAESEHRISGLELGPANDSAVHEVDVRGRPPLISLRSGSSLAVPTASGNATPVRPQSVILRRDKSLPPLPGESSVEFPNHPMPDIARPQTMYNLMQTPSNPQTGGLAPPQAPFRTSETRRQSFHGMASSPHPAIRSLPTQGPYGRSALNAAPFLAEPKYGEFGASDPALVKGARRMSLGTPKVKQRRSKFGLASLFGKKSPSGQTQDSLAGSPEPLDYHPYRTSSDHRDEPSINGKPSTHSSHMRMSVVSKKNIAELVEQDPEFVAYRYPSSDQRLELSR